MKVLEEYCQRSTIHGFFYLTKQKSYLERWSRLLKNIFLRIWIVFDFFSRSFWIIALLVSVVLTTILIAKLFIQSVNAPILMTLSDEELSVKEVSRFKFLPMLRYDFEWTGWFRKIPFPAVTLCPSMDISAANFSYENIVNGFENGELSLDNLTMTE